MSMGAWGLGAWAYQNGTPVLPRYGEEFWKRKKDNRLTPACPVLYLGIGINHGELHETLVLAHRSDCDRRLFG